MESLIIIVSTVLGIWLLFQSWFWYIVCLIGGLVSLFYCLANIFHFQILAALGFLVLACIQFGIVSSIHEKHF